MMLEFMEENRGDGDSGKDADENKSIPLNSSEESFGW